MPMKGIAATIVTLGLSCFVVSGLAGGTPDEPCQNKYHEPEIRECYAKEQARLNAEADSLVTEIAAAFRKDADSCELAVDRELMRKAASALVQSQETWKVYRDQHCKAVEFSYTTGSGARTAYEGCRFDVGRQRVQDLRSDFELHLPQGTDHNIKK
jgi:uncharacterized protein YecT (DUF1311 family)